jgi:hypothetical protein
MTICIVSNGHGEDILASELAKQLALEHEVVALPLVVSSTTKQLEYQKRALRRVLNGKICQRTGSVLCAARRNRILRWKVLSTPRLK